MYDWLAFRNGIDRLEEHSVRKRPSYKDYQAKVPIVFPVAIPFVAHDRIEIWPLIDTTAMQESSEDVARLGRAHV